MWESKPLTVTVLIFKSLRFGDLVVNSSSPIFSVAKLAPDFMYTECFLSLQHVLQNACCFCVDLIFLFTHMPNGNAT